MDSCTVIWFFLESRVQKASDNLSLSLTHDLSPLCVSISRRHLPPPLLSPSSTQISIAFPAARIYQVHYLSSLCMFSDQGCVHTCLIELACASHLAGRASTWSVLRRNQANMLRRHSPAADAATTRRSPADAVDQYVHGSAAIHRISHLPVLAARRNQSALYVQTIRTSTSS